MVHKTFTFYLKDALKFRFPNLLHKVNLVPTDQDAILANILDHQTASILTEVLRGNVLLLCLHSVHTTKQRSIPFGHLHQLLVQRRQGPLLCFIESR